MGFQSLAECRQRLSRRHKIRISIHLYFRREPIDIAMHGGNWQSPSPINDNKRETVHPVLFWRHLSAVLLNQLLWTEGAILLGPSVARYELGRHSIFDLSSAISRLSSIESHNAMFLLHSCFCAPKIQHISRCTPCHGHRGLWTPVTTSRNASLLSEDCNQPCFVGSSEATGLSTAERLRKEDL